MMAIQAQLYSDNFGVPLGGSQYWMDNSYGFNEFCFNLPQKQQQQQQQLQNQQQKTQIPCFENNGLVSKNGSHPSMAFSQRIAADFVKQSQEADQLISLQNERLRLALQEHRKQETELLLRKYEAKTLFLLKQKDEELAKAMKKAVELEELLRRMEIESQTWQRVAKENEAMVVSLNRTIEQIKENACSANGVEDAESCCDVNNRGDREDETEKNRGHGNDQENEEQITRKMACKSCNSWSSCVIFLPCRHLCSCKACQAFLDSCPVCGMVKKASIEALF